VWDDDDNIARGIQLTNIEDGIVSGNKVVMLGGTKVNIGIYTLRCDNVDVFNNSGRLGAIGTPIALAQSGGITYGNVSKGGGVTSSPYVNLGDLSGQNLADSFSFDITFNGTATPTISNSTAPDVVGAASAISQGVRVELSNLPSIARYRAYFVIRSAEGIVHTPSASGDTFLYSRAISSGALEIGMKPTGPDGGHSPANNFGSGTISVTVFLS
jgi:hypothetical protein